MKTRAFNWGFIHHWALRGAVITFTGLSIEYGAQFIRSILLTHRLDPRQFGVASAMAATLALIDMSTGLGADRYLVQSRHGGSPTALAVAHSVTLARGVLSAGLLLLLAIPTARLLNVPQYASGFACLAIIPIIRGFEHLRLAQLQRQHRFLGSTTAASCANLAGLLAVVAASIIIHDYRAILWGMGFQAVLLVLASHVGARRRYRVSISRVSIDRALHFGLPLMINGLALAAVVQCDRLAVGHFLGLVAVAHYTIAVMTFYLPTSLFLRLLVSVAQPRLSAAWHASPRGEFLRIYGGVNAFVAAVASGFALGVSLLGNLVLTKVFGTDYAVAPEFLAIYGLFVFLRFAKTSVNLAGLAMGRTTDLMLSNLPGIVTLAASCVVLSLWRSLIVVATSALVGELIGIAVACYRLQAKIDIRQFVLSFLVAVSLPIMAGLWVVLADPSSLQRLIAASVGLGIAIGAVGVQRSGCDLPHWVGNLSGLWLRSEPSK